MIEQLILSHLVYNEEYTRKVLPFIKSEYFDQRKYQVVFELISEYIVKYNKNPTKESLLNSLENVSKISEDEYKASKEIIGSLQADKLTKVDYLLEETEKFCQDKAIYNAIRTSINVLDGKESKLTKGSIPQLLTDALSVCFDTNIGHDYIDDAAIRFELYHQKEANRVPFDIEFLNKITKGGLLPKTLNLFLAPLGVGKSLVMCHCAAANLSQGKNVLYITMEMAEDKIAERIDANLMNIPIDELNELPKSSFDKKIDRIKEKTQGKLIIKEYGVGSVNSAHFRHLLQELRLKKKFIPDIIYIDYLSICASFRTKLGGSVNSYLYNKYIAEELRALAVEFKIPIVSAIQSNREGINNSDIDTTNTSESIGVPMTADLLIAVISTEELEKMGQYLFIQLKSRYSDLNKNKRFLVGVDKMKMRLHDVEQTAQNDIHDSGQKNKTSKKTIPEDEDRPVMDKSSFGKRLNDEKRKKFNNLIMD